MTQNSWRNRLSGRGDVYLVPLDPIEGREMRGTRPVMVLTTEEFNRYNPPMCAPITQGGDYSRLQGFAVTLMGTGMSIQGAVIVSQVRSLDLVARQAKYVECAPDEVIADACGRLQEIFSVEA